MTAADVFACQQICGEVHGISRIQRRNMSVVQIIDCGCGDSGGGEPGEDVVNANGASEDDAEA